MKGFLKKHGIKLGLAVLLVAAIAAGAAGLSGGRAPLLSNLAGDVRTPVQNAATAAVSWLEELYGYIYKYDQLAAENEALKKQLAEAETQVRQAQAAVDENTRLRDLLKLSETHADFKYADVKIISRSASNWANTMTINKGEKSGLAVGDPVVTSNGELVGQIVELGDTWSTIRTVVDLDISIGALVGEAGNAAMVIGDFTLMQSGNMKLTYLTEGTSLLEGDSVLTSGKGGVFPEGLIIGTIQEVHTEAGGQTPYGVLAPACDLGALSQVFVITDFSSAE